MKLQYFLSLSAFVLTPVYTVTYSDFPQCAQDCIYSSAAQLGGDTNDKIFTCKSSAFLDAVNTCEAKTCSETDISRIFRLGIQLCEPVGGTNAIGLGNLPTCAQPGLAIATTESGCSTTDWTCVCTSSAYTIITAEYESQYCSPADLQAIAEYTGAACAAVGVQLRPLARPSSVSSSLPAASSAQSVYDLPQCAQPCLDAALLQSGCQPSDWTCICVNPFFLGDELNFCESQSCSADDQNEIVNVVKVQCSAFVEVLAGTTTLSGAGATISNPLAAATVSLVLPTESVPGSLPTFSDLPDCAQYCATNATTKNGGSVADLDFFCKTESVLSSDRACRSALCSPTDQQTINGLAPRICQPVGGFAPINSTVNPSGPQPVISAAYPTTTVVASIINVPPCAKPCLVTAFRESGCALDDVACQCSNNAFTNLFTDCQAAVCGVLDLQRLLPFTIKRCGSVGITIPASVLSVESDIAYYIPTSTASLPTPTDLSNAPNDIAGLPSCAQECIYRAASFASCDIHNLTCICTSEAFNSYVSVCEVEACTANELQVIEAYALALCTPVPGHNSVVPTGTLLSSYLAVPTYSASKPSSPTNVPVNNSALPYCAQSCVYPAAAAANCSSVNDLTCICKNPNFLSLVEQCERANCNNTELENIAASSQVLCQPVGGVLQPYGNLTNASSTGKIPPRVTPFTGDAAIVKLRVLDYVVGIAMWFTWTL